MDNGKRDKVLQPPASNANAANAPNSTPAPQPNAPDVAPEPTLEPEPLEPEPLEPEPLEPEPQNSVPFLSEQEPAKEPLPGPLQEENPELG